MLSERNAFQIEGVDKLKVRTINEKSIDTANLHFFYILKNG